MANPQVEDGHTRIANEIMDALCKIRIPGEERQVLDVIIRKTYGWNKIEDKIALSQFVEMTGMNKPHIIQSIKGLLLKKVITVTENGNALVKVYKLNKNFDTWKPLPKKVKLPKTVKSVTENSNAPLPKTVPTKDTNTKDKKDNIKAAEKILSFLNERAKKNFKPTSSTVAFISKRIKEGFTEENFHTVILDRCSKWENDPKMKEYIRPETLFGAKFDSYLNNTGDVNIGYDPNEGLYK